MGSKILLKILVSLLLFLMILTNIVPSQALPAGIPRRETLIVDSIHGRLPAPTQTNPWRPGDMIGSGVHNLVVDTLWYIDHGTGQFINTLASALPTYTKDFKSLTISLRKGIYWNDGKEFTADDVVFTLKYLADRPGLHWSAECKEWIKEVKKVDKYKVQIILNKPNPRFHFLLTCDIWWGLYIMPKHVFEKVEDPLKFDFFPPVGTGPYKYKSHDPEGYWVLFERREDWQRSPVGIIRGRPAPRYILFVHYGPEEKRIAAQIRHELDWIFDTTTEGWYTLMKGSPTSRSWFKDFPWAFFHDPTARGIYFNNAKSPYDKREVRWALTLAINMYDVMITAYDAIQILMATHGGPGVAHFNLYHKGMLDWLKEFSFPDGYKPFDATLPYKLADYARGKGFKVTKEPIDIWGVGWWKYDPDKATKMLTGLGFRKVAGKWYLPDGKPWVITIKTPTYEIDATRLGFAVADQWREFGIDVKVETLEAGPFWSDYNIGNFEVGTYWGAGQAGIMEDLWHTHRWWHKENVQPVGEVALSNQVRFKNDKISELLDKLGGMSPREKRAIDIAKEVLKELIREMPIIPAVDCKKFSPYDTYYWTNFPSGDNPYWSCLFWCGGFKWITPRLKSTGK